MRISSFIAAAAARNEILGSRGLGVTISPNGLPDFNDFVAPRGGVFIPLTGNRGQDKINARLARGLPDNPLYTWHHHEAIGVMMLVRRDKHAAVGHAGGVFFWEILNDKKYR